MSTYREKAEKFLYQLKKVEQLYTQMLENPSGIRKNMEHPELADQLIEGTTLNMEEGRQKLFAITLRDSKEGQELLNIFSSAQEGSRGQHEVLITLQDRNDTKTIQSLPVKELDFPQILLHALATRCYDMDVEPDLPRDQITAFRRFVEVAISVRSIAATLSPSKEAITEAGKRSLDDLPTAEPVTPTQRF